VRDILRCDDLSGEDIAGRQESNRFAPSNKSLQPTQHFVVSFRSIMKPIVKVLGG
jgi:hypothetical protein